MFAARLITGRTASPRTTCVVHAGSNLESWQLTKLHRAARQGRRHIKIEKLCQDVELSRPEVLQWLKANPAPLETQNNDSNNNKPTTDFFDDDFDKPSPSPSSSSSGFNPQQQDSWSAVNTPTSRRSQSPPSSPYDKPRQQQQRTGNPNAGNTNLPPWKRFIKDKKNIGRQAEATLEMIYSRTEWPSDDVISSMWDLHRMQKPDVIQWFRQRRTQGKPPPRERKEQRRDTNDDTSGDDSGW